MKNSQVAELECVIFLTGGLSIADGGRALVLLTLAALCLVSAHVQRWAENKASEEA